MPVDTTLYEPVPIEVVASDFMKKEFSSKAQSTTMLNFLEEYSLHDSNWQDLSIDPTGQSIVALIAWDTHWSKGRIPYPPFQYLFVHFEEVFQILFGKNRSDNVVMDTISGADARVIQNEERDALLTLGVNLGVDDNCIEHYLESTLHLTRIEDILGGLLNVVHHPKISILCINAETGEFIHIPDLKSGE